MHLVPRRVEFRGELSAAKRVLPMGKRQLKKGRRTQYRKKFKTAKKRKGKKPRTPARKVK